MTPQEYKLVLSHAKSISDVYNCGFQYRDGVIKFDNGTTIREDMSSVDCLIMLLSNPVSDSENNFTIPKHYIPDMLDQEPIIILDYTMKTIHVFSRNLNFSITYANCKSITGFADFFIPGYGPIRVDIPDLSIDDSVEDIAAHIQWGINRRIPSMENASKTIKAITVNREDISNVVRCVFIAIGMHFKDAIGSELGF